MKICHKPDAGQMVKSHKNVAPLLCYLEGVKEI